MRPQTRELYTWVDSAKEDPELARYAIAYAVGFHSAEHGEAIGKFLETANRYYQEEKGNKNHVRFL